MKRMSNDPDMLEEYDFSQSVRGKYAQRYAERTNVVVLEPDVAEFFPDHVSVNEALRSLISIIKNNGKRLIKNQLPSAVEYQSVMYLLRQLSHR